LAGAGDLTLADTHYGIHGENAVPAFSVIRTGTGNLSLVAGGAIDEESSYGVYTAGAQSPAILNGAGQDPYDLPQGNEAGTSLLGPNNTALAALVANYAANYPTNGGNLLVAAQGNLNGFLINGESVSNSDALGNWLWRQGGAGEPGAWWVEYGTLTVAGGIGTKPYQAQYTGFQGIGTLGGGQPYGQCRRQCQRARSGGRFQWKGTSQWYPGAKWRRSAQRDDRRRGQLCGTRRLGCRR
jgi:hypothetical protein